MNDLYIKADKAYDLGEFSEAFNLFMSIVESDGLDKAYAMDRIASMYDAGEGIDYDFDKAIYWYKKALEYDETVSLHNLGVTYRTKGNILEAKTWFQASLDAKNYDSALDLAKIYMACDNQQSKVIYFLEKCLEGDNLFEDVEIEAKNLLQELKN